jgi:hypothetical protein
MTIYDPPNLIKVISKEELKKRWNGAALVFNNKIEKEIYNRTLIEYNEYYGPRIYFYETSYIAGAVHEGSKLSHTFYFSNIGTEPLEISARSTCSCTKIILSSNNIQPGKIEKITLENKNIQSKGKISQGAFIKTNDKEQPLIKLSLEATILPSIRVIPEKINIGDIKVDNIIKKEIIVDVQSDSSLKVLSIKTTKGIKAQILPIRNNNIRVIPILLTIYTGKIPGNFEKQITIKTNDNYRPEIPIKISGSIIGLAKVFPPMIFFGNVNADREVLQELIITSINGKKLEFEKIDTGSPFVSAEIIPIQNDKYKLKIFLKADKNVVLDDSLKVFIKNNNIPILQIPFFARITKIIRNEG